LVELKTERTDFLARLALTKKAVKVVGDVDDSKTVGKLAKIVGGKTFRVSSHDKKIERDFGGKLAARGLKVELRKPDVEVVVDEKLAGVSIPLARDFEKRKPQHRPYFHPTSMHPKLARALVNLAAVKKGVKILDPFCGTGGILIEAGLVGLKVLGRDIDGRMVEGCKKNLSHYSLRGDVKKGDAIGFSGKVDAIVTDPPYGRASYAGGLEAGELAKKFVSAADEMLKKGGRLVIVTPKEVRLRNPRLKKLAHYDIRVHKSLTRRITVFIR
jgi:tRNA (guanine10-N2)-dimethyltransferase